MKYKIYLDFETYVAEDIEADTPEDALKIAEERLKNDSFVSDVCGWDYEETK